MQRITVSANKYGLNTDAFLYVSTSEFSTLGTFSTSSKSDIKPIDYVRNCVLDKHFVV